MDASNADYDRVLEVDVEVSGLVNFRGALARCVRPIGNDTLVYGVVREHVNMYVDVRPISAVQRDHGLVA